MAGFPWGEVLAPIVGSGTTSATLTGYFQSRERRHATQQQALDRAAQAHAAARDKYLPDVGRAIEYLDYRGNQEYGLDLGDYTVDHLVAPDVSSIGEVIVILRRVAREHPTQAVRKQASEIASSVDSTYGGALKGGDYGEEPPVEDFIRWTKLGDGLLEAMHLAPAPDVSRRRRLGKKRSDELV